MEGVGWKYGWLRVEVMVVKLVPHPCPSRAEMGWERGCPVRTS